MFKLSAKEMNMLEKTLKSTDYSHVQNVRAAKGCPNCNGQCKNGCGVTCVAILS